MEGGREDATTKPILLLRFQLHRDDGTKESGEGVVTAALGVGGVVVVVRGCFGQQRSLRVGSTGELFLEAGLVGCELCAELLGGFAFFGWQSSKFIGCELSSFDEREGTAVRLTETVHIGEFGSFGRSAFEITRVGRFVGFLYTGVKDCAGGGADFLLAEDSAVFGVLAVEFLSRYRSNDYFGDGGF